MTWAQIRFIADPTAEFTKALDLGFDEAAAIFGGTRSKRYALKVEDGKITETHVEPDGTGADGKPIARVSDESWLYSNWYYFSLYGGKGSGLVLCCN